MRGNIVLGSHLTCPLLNQIPATVNVQDTANNILVDLDTESQRRSDFSVPFCQDRLIPIFLATLAVQQKSRMIRFRAAAEMLENFGMHTVGKEYRRLVAAFERIFGAAIYFGADNLPGSAELVQRSRFNFMSEAQIWYSRLAEQRVLCSEFENVVVLTEGFYREVTEHPVPNDLDSVKVLASAPAVLDLYMWLSYRCFKAKGPESMSCGAHLIAVTSRFVTPRNARACSTRGAYSNAMLITIATLWLHTVVDVPASNAWPSHQLLRGHSP